MSFRNIIGTEALANVQVFLKRFKGPEKVKAYVKSGMIYYGEIPFLYKSFEPMAVRLKAERGGYKVVSGFQSLRANTMMLNRPPGVARPVQEPSNLGHCPGLLREARCQAIPSNRFLARQRPIWDACPHMHCGTVPHTLLTPRF